MAWAYAYLAIRDRERALRFIEEAGNTWSNLPLNLIYLKVNAFQDPVLDELEFVEVRERLGYTDL